VEIECLPTPNLDGDADAKMGRFDAFLCAPGGPYKSPEGALNGIRFT
jgi:hypothetical protein